MEDTPKIFEQLLQAINSAQLPLQLKMFQRADELIKAHLKAKNKGRGIGGLRGDGIMINTYNRDADKALEIIYSVINNNIAAFQGRRTSRLPYPISEGVAIGDEPRRAPGHSLTSHRAAIVEKVAKTVRDSGEQSHKARTFFRLLTASLAQAEDVNPANMAFNAKFYQSIAYLN